MFEYEQISNAKREPVSGFSLELSLFEFSFYGFILGC